MLDPKVYFVRVSLRLFFGNMHEIFVYDIWRKIEDGVDKIE